MAKTIMILGASILQLPAIKKATEMGLNVIALDMNPNAIGFSVPGVAREVISTIDIDRAVAAAKKHKIDGVMTLATDLPMRTVAAIAKECGLIGLSIESSIKATDKAVMREALKQAGVPIPRFVCVASEEEYIEATKQFKNAIVVKPTDSSGSRGVVLVEQELQNLEAYDYAKAFSRNGKVIVEEYMMGKEVSVETLAIGGKVYVIQITDKMTTGAPHFAEIGHTQPSRLDDSTQSQIANLAIAANAAIGINDGPSHTEIIVTDDGPKIVELGARLGGDCITTHLVPLSTGVDLVKACINIALGEKPDIEAVFSKGAAIRYFKQYSGIIQSIDITEAEKSDGVKQISIVHGEGERITDIVDSGSRMGFVITQGQNADDAARKADNALERIKVVIK